LTCDFAGVFGNLFFRRIGGGEVCRKKAEAEQVRQPQQEQVQQQIHFGDDNQEDNSKDKQEPTAKAKYGVLTATAL
jgi:hypothetical protein